MHLKRFLTTDDAVSSVVATVLMVAIVVVLSSVISAYVLGMAEEVQNPAPQASFLQSQEDAAAELTGGGGSTVDVTNVTLTHDAGDELPSGTVEVTANGRPAVGCTNAAGGTDSTVVVPFRAGASTASDTATVAFYADGGGTPTHGARIDHDGGTPVTENAVSLTPLSTGDVVRVTWTSEDGDRSAFVTEYEVG